MVKTIIAVSGGALKYKSDRLNDVFLLTLLRSLRVKGDGSV